MCLPSPHPLEQRSSEVLENEASNTLRVEAAWIGESRSRRACFEFGQPRLPKSRTRKRPCQWSTPMAPRAVQNSDMMIKRTSCRRYRSTRANAVPRHTPTVLAATAAVPGWCMRAATKLLLASTTCLMRYVYTTLELRCSSCIGESMDLRHQCIPITSHALLRSSRAAATNMRFGSAARTPSSACAFTDGGTPLAFLRHYRRQAGGDIQQHQCLIHVCCDPYREGLSGVGAHGDCAARSQAALGFARTT